MLCPGRATGTGGHGEAQEGHRRGRGTAFFARAGTGTKARALDALRRATEAAHEQLAGDVHGQARPGITICPGRSWVSSCEASSGFPPSSRRCGPGARRPSSTRTLPPDPRPALAGEARSLASPVRGTGAPGAA